jgi:hypothetical protein
MPHFVVVEDDHLQEGPIADNLAGSFPDATVEAFATEGGVPQTPAADARDGPDLVIMDVMLAGRPRDPDCPRHPTTSWPAGTTGQGCAAPG